MNSILVILTLVNAAIGARESTRVFQSDKTPTGIIYTRNFPYSYIPIEVEIFEFRGREHEKVQITFDKFNLYPKTTVNERCGIEGSFISYKKTEKSSDYEKFCGDRKPLPIMSENEHFILRYEGVTVPTDIRESNEEIGFNATFRFVTNFGLDYKTTEGENYNGCDFTYLSENSLNGTFSSPNFPGMYPGHVLCYYTFIGAESNIVFTFTQFNLLGSRDCDVENEKKDRLQILKTSDGSGQENKLEFCGSHRVPFNITITNTTAFFIFHHQTNYSDYELAKYEYVGFNGTFLFINETVPNSCDRRLPGIVSIYICIYLILSQRLLL